MTEEPRLADLEGLRRIERYAVVWGVVAALGYGIAASWPAALALTAAAAVSIVAFRGLQRIVSALGPEESQPAGRSSPTEPREAPRHQEPTGNHIDRRTGLGAEGIGVLVRLALLGVVAAVGAFSLEPEHFPAIVLGFSTLPAALMTEGLRQAVRAYRGRGRDSS